MVGLSPDDRGRGKGSSMRKTIAAAAVAGSLLGGAAVGATLLGGPSLVGAQESSDSTTTTVAPGATTAPADKPERKDWLADAIAPLVEDDTLTQAQADAVIGAIEAAKPARAITAPASAAASTVPGSRSPRRPSASTRRRCVMPSSRGRRSPRWRRPTVSTCRR
jgi:hypothetical protein